MAFGLQVDGSPSPMTMFLLRLGKLQMPRIGVVVVGPVWMVMSGVFGVNVEAWIRWRGWFVEERISREPLWEVRRMGYEV